MKYLDLFPRIGVAIIGDDAATAPIAAALRTAGHMTIRQPLAAFDAERMGDMAIDVVIVMAQPDIALAAEVVAAIRRGTFEAARGPVIVIGARSSGRGDEPYADAGLTVHLDDAFVAGDLTMALRQIALDRERARLVGRDAAGSLVDPARIAALRAAFGADQAARFLSMADEEMALRPRRIRRLLAIGDDHRARREAHSLKGAIVNVGAIHVARLAEELERARAGTLLLDIADQLVASGDATRAALLAE